MKTVKEFVKSGNKKEKKERKEKRERIKKKKAVVKEPYENRCLEEKQR